MEKTNMIPFLVSTFLLITLSSFTADAATTPVLDTLGESLVTGTFYYVLPANTSGGGLTTGAGHNGSICPLDVVQAANETDNGLPLTFSPVNVNLTTDGEPVPVSTDLNIKFSARAYRVCAASNVWRLVANSTGVSFVSTGGVEGNPGRETIANWFNIQQYDDYYKLVYCPTVCDICRPICGDLGIYVDENGTRRLALSEVPLKVKFQKV